MDTMMDRAPLVYRPVRGAAAKLPPAIRKRKRSKILVFLGSSIDRITILENAPAAGFTCTFPCTNCTLVGQELHVPDAVMCTHPTLNVIVLHHQQPWGSFPYGPVHWCNPVPNGIDAFVPGLAEVQPDMPLDFTERLNYLMSNKWPLLAPSFTSGKEVFVFWRVSLWQVANMNERTPGGLFPEKSLTDSYIDGFARNISQHLTAMASMLNKSELTQVIFLNPAEHQYLEPFLGGSQNPHVRVLNLGLQRAAQLQDVLVMDPRPALAGLSKLTVMRDTSHPKPWVLKTWWARVMALCQVNTGPSRDPMGLPGQIGKIKEVLQLDSSLPMLAAVKEANLMVGIEPQGQLPTQVATLLAALELA
jgi:hypothetical protein